MTDAVANVPLSGPRVVWRRAGWISFPGFFSYLKEETGWRGGEFPQCRSSYLTSRVKGMFWSKGSWETRWHSFPPPSSGHSVAKHAALLSPLRGDCERIPPQPWIEGEPKWLHRCWHHGIGGAEGSSLVHGEEPPSWKICPGSWRARKHEAIECNRALQGLL